MGDVIMDGWSLGCVLCFLCLACYLHSLWQRLIIDSQVKGHWWGNLSKTYFILLLEVLWRNAAAPVSLSVLMRKDGSRPGFLSLGDTDSWSQKLSITEGLTTCCEIVRNILATAYQMPTASCVHCFNNLNLFSYCQVSLRLNLGEMHHSSPISLTV